jgi:hypothetical protein
MIRKKPSYFRMEIANKLSTCSSLSPPPPPPSSSSSSPNNGTSFV